MFEITFHPDKIVINSHTATDVYGLEILRQEQELKSQQKRDRKQQKKLDKQLSKYKQN